MKSTFRDQNKVGLNERRIYILRTPVPLAAPRYSTSKWKGLENLEKRTSGSLIPDTLREMEKDTEFQITGESVFFSTGNYLS